MSDRESGFGSFVLGVTIGVLIGLLFAPEPGEELRGRLGRRVRSVRDRVADRFAGEEDEPAE